MFLKNIFHKIITICCFMIYMCNSVHALSKSDLTTIRHIKSSLHKSLPELPIDEVNRSAMPDIYEVISGYKVFYVDKTGRYIFLGNMVDLNTKQSLTELKVKQLRVVDWNKLPLDLAIVRVIGNGGMSKQRRIAIFTDPDCPFCKQLEKDVISKLKDITVYYFLFPLDIHANAKDDSKRILCSITPINAFVDLMENGAKLPKRTDCSNATQLDKMIEVGNKVIQVEVTPTIILPDGEQITGLISLDYLNELISRQTVVKKPTTPSIPIINLKTN